jgi:hypothetical protein
LPLKDLEIEFFARQISAEIEKAGFVERKKGYEVVKDSLEELKKIENEIERKAEELFSQHISKFPDADKEVALDMIRKRLAEQKGIEGNYTSERPSFLTSWISKRLIEKIGIKDSERLIKCVRSVLSECWNDLLKISAEVSNFLSGKGIKQYTLEWDKRFSEEFSRRLKERLRKG